MRPLTIERNLIKIRLEHLFFEGDFIKVKNSHIQVPKCVLKQFENEKQTVFYYDPSVNEVKMGRSRTLNTEEGYYSNQMEDILNNSIENPLGNLIAEIKKYDFSKLPIPIPKNIESVVFKYFDSLLARSTITINKFDESIYLQFLPKQNQHDIAVFSMLSETPAEKRLGEYIITLCVNFTDITFVLPAIGVFSYHYNNDSFINIPITPTLCFHLIKTDKPEKYIKNNSVALWKIDEREITRSMNAAAFVSELSGNKRFIASPNRDELELLKSQFDSGKFNDIIKN